MSEETSVDSTTPVLEAEIASPSTETPAVTIGDAPLAAPVPSALQSFKGEVEATGRRKTAVARVKLQPGKGGVKINGRDIEDYFPTQPLRIHALAPLVAVDSTKRFDITVRTHGGGPMGQAGAVSHAIARALVEIDGAVRTTLKKPGYLRRDPRMKERKKSGQPGARKRFQFSKR